MPHITPGVIGWDIGGVNTKAVTRPVPRIAARFPSRSSTTPVPSGRRSAAWRMSLGADGRAARDHDDGRAFPGVPDEARGRRRRARCGRARVSRADRPGLHGGRPIRHSGRGTVASARGGGIQLGGHRPAGRPVRPGLHSGRHRHHLHRHHPDREGRGRGIRPHRSRAPRERRAGLHRRAPHAVRGRRRGGAARWSAVRGLGGGVRAHGRRASLVRAPRARRTTRCGPPTAARPRGRSPASVWRASSARTAKC